MLKVTSPLKPQAEEIIAEKRLGSVPEEPSQNTLESCVKSTSKIAESEPCFH